MKPFQKRSRLEIIRDILKVIRDSNSAISPTKLLRFSNLSYQMFEEYLGELEGKGLVELKPYKGKRKIYSLTEKGRMFLEKYEDFVSFLRDFGL
ncbi:winged helix-turn-helix domain-containing protein [Methanosarcina sp. Mfa9]|uniref:winged helix-turn-helix domain-containing protein n=1 Tax=Methanosarcina sp. Mfa9 TaxID=3439063 RepID=UPI003F825F13